MSSLTHIECKRAEVLGSLFFCLGTEVPRRSAGSIYGGGTYSQNSSTPGVHTPTQYIACLSMQ